MAEVRLVDVSKRFGGLAAVARVSLHVPEGSFYTLLGPSGCGKTTTLRIVAGFYPPDRGDVFIGTTRVNDLPPYLRQTAMVLQEYALFPHMTVFENVAYGLRMRHVGSPDLARRVAAALSLVGLSGVERIFPSRLSGGQQQRVALARALVAGDRNPPARGKWRGGRGTCDPGAAPGGDQTSPPRSACGQRLAGTDQDRQLPRNARPVLGGSRRADLDCGRAVPGRDGLWRRGLSGDSTRSDARAWVGGERMINSEEGGNGEVEPAAERRAHGQAHRRLSADDDDARYRGTSEDE